MWALGVTGTYLGDYFGILMDAKVEGFPFNVTSAPMYWGSTMSFLGYSLLTGKVAGLLLTAEVFVMYLAALQFEEYVGSTPGARHANVLQPFHGRHLCKERYTTADKVNDQEHPKEEQELVSRDELSTQILRAVRDDTQANQLCCVMLQENGRASRPEQQPGARREPDKSVSLRVYPKNIFLSLIIDMLSFRGCLALQWLLDIRSAAFWMDDVAAVRMNAKLRVSGKSESGTRHDLRRRRHRHNQSPQEAPFLTNIPCAFIPTVVYRTSSRDGDGKSATTDPVILIRDSASRPSSSRTGLPPPIRPQCPRSSRKRRRCSQTSKEPYAERKDVRAS
jgi:hypothetical protein